jgi:transposase
MTVLITMSQKELDRSHVFKKLAAGQLNGSEAAKCLKLTVRQVRRLKVKYIEDGAKGLMHASRGRPGNRRLPDKEITKIEDLLKSKYADFKPGFAAEKLESLNKIKRDPKTIRKIMIDLDLWKPRKEKAGSEYHSWRERKDNLGELVQYDGSYEMWLEDRGPRCCLLASIDDAKGEVDGQFGFNEGTMPTMEYWHDYFVKHGKPQAIYVDKFSTYSQNHKVAKENADNLPQFARAMKEVNVELIKANSPQAKGRVERLFRTLQDRLIKELRLANISTIEQANEFLQKTFLPEFNARFMVEPKGKANLHRKLSKAEIDGLKSILSRQNIRVIQNDFTVSHNKIHYQILKEQKVTICRKDRVIIEERFDGTLHMRLRGKYLNYQILPEAPKKHKTTEWIIAASDGRSKGHAPKIDHPWRRKQFIYANSLMSAK